MIITFFGNGKGKTSAALGIALRAAGWDKVVTIYQFIKSSETGEILSSNKIKGVEIIQGGKGFVGIEGDTEDIKEHSKSAQKLLSRIQEDICIKKIDILVLDEVLVALDLNLISEDKLIDFINSCKENIDIVLTGRPKNQRIIELSNMVSEIKSIKHPYDKGVMAKKGIDW